MIWNRYRYQIFLDDLPNATMEKNAESGEYEANYKEGIFVGAHNSHNEYVIYNHLDITVKTHHVSGGDEVRIVGLEVTPRSIKAGSSLDAGRIESQPQEILKFSNGDLADITSGITFSYSIKTINDETTTWASRMDHYYAIGKYDVHMKQIFISLGIMLAASFTAFGYVKVSLTRDFALLHGGMTSRTQRRATRLRQHGAAS